jgi:hypothetical protein
MEAGSGGGGGITDSVQKAIDDLRGAGEKATGDVRAQIDSAVSRLREATSGATSRASDQAGDWRETLESVTEDVRLQLGKLAIRAQTSKAAIEELEEEVKKRKKELKRV